MPISFKVGCKTAEDKNWAYNALRFATQDQAVEYGKDLYRRWTLLREWEVHPSDEEPNKGINTQED